MDHDMYLLSFYFVFTSVSEQLGILNDLFCQLFESHTVSGAFCLKDMFRVQENIGPHRAITGILTDFSPCQWIKGFQISIEQILDIIFVLYLQCLQLFLPDAAAFVRQLLQKAFQKKIIVIKDGEQLVVCWRTGHNLFQTFDNPFCCGIQIVPGFFI